MFHTKACEVARHVHLAKVSGSLVCSASRTTAPLQSFSNKVGSSIHIHTQSNRKCVGFIANNVCQKRSSALCTKAQRVVPNFSHLTLLRVQVANTVKGRSFSTNRTCWSNQTNHYSGVSSSSESYASGISAFLKGGRLKRQGTRAFHNSKPSVPEPNVQTGSQSPSAKGSEPTSHQPHFASMEGHTPATSPRTPSTHTTQDVHVKHAEQELLSRVHPKSNKKLQLPPPAKGHGSPVDQVIEGLTKGLVPEMRHHAAKATVRAVVSIRQKVAQNGQNGNHAPNIDDESLHHKVPLFRLFGLVRSELKRLSMAMGAVLISSVASLAFPTAVGKVIDLVSHTGNSDEVQMLVLGMLGLVFGGAIAVFVRVSLLAIVSERVARQLRKHVFQCMVHQKMSFFDYNDTGRLVNRLSTDTSMVASTLTDNVARTLKSGVASATSTVFLWQLSPKLTLLSFTVLPLFGLTAVAYGEYRKRLTQGYLTRLALENQVSTERLYGIRTVHSFVAEDREYQRYVDAVDASFVLARKVGIAEGAFLAGGFLVAQGTLLGVLWYGSQLMMGGLMTVGKLTSFSMYTGYLFVSVGQVSVAVSEFMKAQGAARRVFTVIDSSMIEGHELGEQDGHILQKGFSERVEFKDVSFAYPTRPESPVLKGFNLTLEPGQTLAIAGPSGSGKSTIGLLLSRYYEPQRGVITLGGVDIAHLDARWLRRQIAEVTQDPLLFSGTVTENIAYGRPEASFEEIVEAAKAANAHEFIMQLPKGYDTEVGEKGKRLSGGQRQRLAIARAMLMDAPLMVLDEATSALDAESEHLVVEALRKAMKGKSAIVFSHHAHVLKAADCVAVLKDGVVVEYGRFEDLVQQGGFFSRLSLEFKESKN